LVFNHVAGVSAGSIAAAAYAIDMTSDEMKEAATGLNKKDILSSKLFFVPSNPQKVEGTVYRLLGDDRDDFTKCKIPLSILAVDIISGREHVLNRSSSIPISRAISASCAVPGVFSPVPYDDMLLMDGGIMNNVPASVLRDVGCSHVVSVHVGNLTTPIAKSAGIIDAVSSSIKILIRATSHKGIRDSDIVIVPELEKQKMMSLDNVETIIEAGYKATMERMNEIKELFRG